MATRFWVGGTTGTWDSTAGTKWATSSGGTGGASAPTSSDDVTFDGAAGGIGAGTITVAATAAAASVTVTGAAVKTTVFSFAASFTTAGAFTVNGNSATNRVLVQSSVVGTARTVTAAAVSLSNVDFMDITGAGAAAPFTGTSLGDCGGNTGITTTTPATQTHTASAGGSWSDASKWTSRVPLPQDDVVVDANTTGTLTADMPRLGKSIDFTGFAGTYNHITSTLYGSLTLASGMTCGSSAGFVFAGRSTYTITTAGQNLSLWYFSFQAPGGTYTLQDALNLSGAGNYVQVLNGTLDTNSQNVTCSKVYVTGNSTKGLTAGTSTFTLTAAVAADTPVQVGATGTTISAASATFIVAAVCTGSRSFIGGGFTYGTLTYTVAASTGTLTLTGANTFGTITLDGGSRTLTLPSSTTTTVTNFVAAGTAGNLITLNASTPGTFATLAKAGGGYVYGLDYLSISDIHAT